MSDALRPPAGWTLYHSIALLLVSASAIDGTVDAEEVGTIRTRLAQYPELEDDAKAVLQQAVHYYESLRKEGMVMKALDKHCRRMAKALPPEARKVVLDDVIAVVGADEELHEHERAYLEAVYSHFGVELPT